MERLEKLEESLKKLRYYKSNLTIDNHKEFDSFIAEVEDLLRSNHRITLNELNYYEIVDPTDDELPF